MSIIKNNKNYGTKVKIERIEPQLPAEQTYFYIDNITNEENTITIKKTSDFPLSVTVYKSTDKVNWELMGTSTVEGISATIPAYGRLYLKGYNTHWGQEEAHYNYFTSTNLVTIGGYLSSLAIGDNYETNETNVPWSRTFYNWVNLLDAKDLIMPNGNNWFYGMFEQSNIKTAPLTVPTVGSGCQLMFAGCKRLTQAPALPATTLSAYCYQAMFRECIALTTAPVLPATTLDYSCYENMFYGCTSLTTAPALPATTLNGYCYQDMFNNCTSLTQAPELPATTLSEYCYLSMFRGCTALTTAPALPATTLADSCYMSMFGGCTALTTAPALPATTLAYGCYHEMFWGCASLTTAPALPATSLAGECYATMFVSCGSLTQAPALPATTLTDGCYNSMFYECTNLNSVTTYAQDISAGGCLDNWLYGVPSTGDFYNLGGATYQSGESGIPEGWTEHNSL